MFPITQVGRYSDCRDLFCERPISPELNQHQTSRDCPKHSELSVMNPTMQLAVGAGDVF